MYGREIFWIVLGESDCGSAFVPQLRDYSENVREQAARQTDIRRQTIRQSLRANRQRLSTSNSERPTSNDRGIRSVVRCQ